MTVRSDVDLTDSTISDALLEKLKMSLGQQGITDLNLSWRTDSSGLAFQLPLINGSLTWYEAQSFCTLKYTDLATVNNMSDKNDLVNTLGSHVTYSWIGLRRGNTHRWMWSDGRGPAHYTRWNVGEPNTNKGSEPCGEMTVGGTWNDIPCRYGRDFACYESRTGALKSKILVETAMNWSDAHSYCRKHHTDLLSVRNQAENQEVQSMVPEGKLAWIGLFQDSWKWSDGSYSSFRYLSQEQPVLGEGPNCAHVYDRKWNKKTFVRISADFDMSDPAVQQQIVSQLEAKMRNMGITDFKINWKMSGQQKQPKQPPIEFTC
ncbi:hypothetical protein F7725_004767 [Dissostichus mawsoni]|uniref:C-type lectin domain-containing protein n=2 Tax=Dissostichus mawsoni TaxID=36200 RepID=A0A7J5XKE4_DISMA|nr:hypothetical protein F7725_004767 [Dissostichus mawsoni]